MADFNIRVKVDSAKAEDGLKRVSKATNNVEKSADKLRSTLTRAIALIGVGAGVREVVQLADTYTNLQNRLRVVTKSQEELTTATEDLFQIAQDTRSNFEATAEVYSRLALSAGELGVTQKELTQFTRSLNKAVAISGATSAEASAGLIQLSQGLASGALRGDELRSVLEQLPAVAQVIAKGLGVTIGQLRTLGAEGKITADTIFRAFANAREEIDERFGKTLPTVAQAFEQLKNAAVKTFGELNQASGGLQLVVNAIQFLAENLDTVIELALKLGFVIGTILAARAIPKLIKSIGLLTTVVKKNPILFGVSAAVTLFGDDLLRIAKNSLNVASAQTKVTESQKRLTAAQEDSLSSSKRNIDLARNYILALDTLTPTIGGYVKQLQDERKFIGASEDRRSAGLAVLKLEKKIREDLAKANIEVSGLIKDELKDQLKRARNATLYNASLERQAELLNRVKGPTNEFGLAVRDASRLLGRGRITLEEFRDILDTTDIGGKFAEIESQAIPAIKTQAQALEELRQEYEKNLKVINEYELTTGDISRALEVSKNVTDRYNESVSKLLNPSLEKQDEILAQIKAPLEEYKTTQEALSNLLRDGAISIQQYNQTLATTQLGGQLQGLEMELAPASDPVTQEQDAYRRRLEALQTFYDMGGEMQRKALALRVTAWKEYSQNVHRIELDRARMLLSAGSQLFGSLTQLAKGFVGEQSDMYRVLFAASKAFAIAEATVAVGQAIAKATAVGFPANIPFIAAAISQTAGLVSQIASVNPQGFQTGGSFKVGGSGNADSQMVMFKASPNETVSVRTPSQQRTAERGSAQAPAPVNNQIVNVLDPSLVIDALSGPEGDRVIINVIKRNENQIAPILSRR